MKTEDNHGHGHGIHSSHLNEKEYESVQPTDVSFLTKQYKSHDHDDYTSYGEVGIPVFQQQQKLNDLNQHKSSGFVINHDHHGPEHYHEGSDHNEQEEGHGHFNHNEEEHYHEHREKHDHLFDYSSIN